MKCYSVGELLLGLGKLDLSNPKWSWELLEEFCWAEQKQTEYGWQVGISPKWMGEDDYWSATLDARTSLEVMQMAWQRMFDHGFFDVDGQEERLVEFLEDVDCL